MPAKKKTNYDKNKEKILDLASRGSLCHHCLARTICDELCRKKGIDKGKQEAPCKEAWMVWSDLNE